MTYSKLAEQSARYADGLELTQRIMELEAKLAKVIELHHNGGLGVLDGGLGYPSGWCTCCGDCWPCQTYRAAKGE